MTNLIRLTRGVWRSAQTTADLTARCAALLTVLPTGSILSGPTAAALHGMWLPHPFEDRLEVTVPASGDRLPDRWPGSVRREVRLRRRSVPERDVEQVDGLRVTTPARTWIDLAEVLEPAELIAAGDWAVSMRCSTDELRHQVRQARHRRGIRRARLCLPLLSPRSESRPESHLRAAVIFGGFPDVEVNVDVVDRRGVWLGRPDLLLRSHRVALEYQGVQHADPQRMRKDMTRFGDLRLGDYDVLLFGPAEVFAHPDRVPALIRSAITRRLRSA